MSNGGSPIGRPLTVWLATTAALGAIGYLAIPLLGGTHPGTDTFDELLVSCCAGVLMVLAGWFWLATTGVVAAVLTGRAHQRIAGCPDLVRRGILLACGLAVGGTMVVPANAATGPASLHERPAGQPSSIIQAAPPTVLWAGHGQARSPGQLDSEALTGLVVPDRLAQPGHRIESAPKGPPAATRHLVQAGDTLWDIAAANLPASATQAQVSRYWHSVYSANLAVIGADPDLIRPGQLLELPQP